MSHKPLEAFMEGNLYVEPCSDEALEFLSFVTKTAERYNIEMGTATNKERQFVLVVLCILLGDLRPALPVVH